MVFPQAKISGSTSVLCSLSVLVSVSMLTRTSESWAEAGRASVARKRIKVMMANEQRKNEQRKLDRDRVMKNSSGSSGSCRKPVVQVRQLAHAEKLYSLVEMLSM